ncbi:hypothetical protein ACFOPI_18755 [Hydrogenophaga luteola]|uniref:Uncharacterized protein n=1 Tax=Hydrogenophaga luteola TaxID=1591122 RepID=A0ABV7W750_9BURK
MKKSIIRVAIALCAIGVGYFIFGAVTDAAASSKSEKICSAVRVGMTTQQLEQFATEGGGWYRASNKDRGRVGASGWNLICRCGVETKDGVVSSVSKSLCIY